MMMSRLSPYFMVQRQTKLSARRCLELRSSSRKLPKRPKDELKKPSWLPEWHEEKMMKRRKKKRRKRPRKT